MEKREVLEFLKGELEQWQTRLDELRLKAGLGKLELRDRRDEALRNFERSYREARERLEGIREGAEGEVGMLRASVEAGWQELRRTYERLREERPPRS